jgi:hypothetical protein
MDSNDGNAPNYTRFKDIALQFAQALIDERFEHAHQQLDTALKAKLPAEKLKRYYQQMLLDDGVTPKAILDVTLESWPDKPANDAFWAYVAIEGNTYSEAVAVTVTHEGLISSIEWGRP